MSFKMEKGDAQIYTSYCASDDELKDCELQ